MKAVEFCYWLQGYFELSDGLDATALQAKQVACIRAHLALVATVDPNHENMFVEWLGSFLSNPPHATGTARIRRMLAAQFQHVIDPSYSGDKATLQGIHDSGKVPGIDVGPSPDMVYRC